EIILNGPAASPPPGTVSNFENPPSKKSLGYGVLIATFTISSLVTAMRFVVKLSLVKKMHTEDCHQAAEVGHVVPSFLVLQFAPIIHQWDLQVKNIIRFLLYFNVGAIMYDVTILFLKLAILIQFLRVFVVPGQRSKTFWITHMLIWTNSIFYFTCVFLEIFACRPIQKKWDPLIVTGSCLNVKVLDVTAAGVNFVSDLLILIFSQKVIWCLNMARSQKAKVAAIFLVGALACAFSGLRFYHSYVIVNTQDIVYYASLAALSSYAETAAGFLVICLPVLPKLCARIKKQNVIS
ncbi:hypothetical protein CC78DRAFT_421731, partial [Lojkania enalia]